MELICNPDQDNKVVHIAIIRWEEIPEINSVTIDGKKHNLGLLKDFKKNKILAKFIPENTTLSLSWVRLKKNEVLDIHEHPISSMVIVSKGEVKLVGEVQDQLNSGDLVAIPSGCKHGFIGSGDDGFWGLSVQFECRGLYENINDPLVNFIEKPSECFNRLIKKNADYLKSFDCNPLFELMRTGVLLDKGIRMRFLDHFQVFSDHFQRMMMNRVTFTDNPLYLPIFEQHFNEEFGHNTRLSEDRGKRASPWDPVLDAASSWFSSKILMLDNLGKIVLVNLVVEASASIFYKNAKLVMNVDEHKSKHFDDHFSDIDESHANYGLELLKNATLYEFSSLFTIQEQGWKMLNTAFTRISELISSNELL